jgi:hypothetical protein
MKKWAKKSDYYFFLILQICAAIILPIFLSLYYQNPNLFTAYYKGLYNIKATNV